MPISKADRLALSDEETFQNPSVAHDIFARMRAKEPLAFCPEPWGGKGFWAITKYDDIETISKLPHIFSSDGKHGGITLPTPEMIANRRNLTRAEVEGSVELADFEGGRSMISMDPPEHNKHRRQVAPGFTPQRLDALIARIRDRADVLLDEVGKKGSVESDFVADVAAELPIQMLAELFDVPQADRYKLFEWSNLMIGGDDPEINVSREQTMGAFMELAAYAMQLYEARKAEPRTDLITMLVNTEVDGEPMSVADYLSAFVLLVVAGNETTRNSMSGGLLALCQHPEQRQKLLDDPGLIPNAVDEIIRWVHPVIYMRRTALQDYALRDVTIRAGDKVAMWYMSANRDEEKWADPFTFDVSREGPRHLSFGYGQHLCLGWRLAEIQLRILLEGVLARYPTLQVTGPVTRMRTNFLNSIKTMPVRYAA
ncbi:MAG: cytochrome [Gammaproteobacteria bacterium]|nr:cytochrome [Gammaproteobacteria bacterium]